MKVQLNILKWWNLCVVLLISQNVLTVLTLQQNKSFYKNQIKLAPHKNEPFGGLKDPLARKRYAANLVEAADWLAQHPDGIEPKTNKKLLKRSSGLDNQTATVNFALRPPDASEKAKAFIIRNKQDFFHNTAEEMLWFEQNKRVLAPIYGTYTSRESMIDKIKKHPASLFALYSLVKKNILKKESLPLVIYELIRRLQEDVMSAENNQNQLKSRFTVTFIENFKSTNFNKINQKNKNKNYQYFNTPTINSAQIINDPFGGFKDSLARKRYASNLVEAAEWLAKHPHGIELKPNKKNVNLAIEKQFKTLTNLANNDPIKDLELHQPEQTSKLHFYHDNARITMQEMLWFYENQQVLTPIYGKEPNRESMLKKIKKHPASLFVLHSLVKRNILKEKNLPPVIYKILHRFKRVVALTNKTINNPNTKLTITFQPNSQMHISKKNKQKEKSKAIKDMQMSSGYHKTSNSGNLDSTLARQQDSVNINDTAKFLANFARSHSSALNFNAKMDIFDNKPAVKHDKNFKKLRILVKKEAVANKVKLTNNTPFLEKQPTVGNIQLQSQTLLPTSRRLLAVMQKPKSFGNNKQYNLFFFQNLDNAPANIEDIKKIWQSTALDKKEIEDLINKDKKNTHRAKLIRIAAQMRKLSDLEKFVLQNPAAFPNIDELQTMLYAQDFEGLNKYLNYISKKMQQSTFKNNQISATNKFKEKNKFQEHFLPVEKNTFYTTYSPENKESTNTYPQQKENAQIKSIQRNVLPTARQLLKWPKTNEISKSKFVDLNFDDDDENDDDTIELKNKKSNLIRRKYFSKPVEAISIEKRQQKWRHSQTKNIANPILNANDQRTAKMLTFINDMKAIIKEQKI